MTNVPRLRAVAMRAPIGSCRSKRVGPTVALAKVQCSILPKHYTDLLTLIHADGRWQIIAKVFHYEVRA
jgi:hypothetical protein